MPWPKVDATGKRTRLLATLTLANLAVAGLLAIAVVMVSGASRSAYEAQAEDTAEGLAAVAQNNLAAELAAVDVLMRATLNELDLMRGRGELTDDAIQRALDGHGRLLTGVEGLRLADASGIVRWGNDLRESAIADISDEAHFVYAREHPDVGVALAGPLQSRVTGHWIMTVVRPWVVQGRFEGMLYAALPLENFQRLFARYELNAEDSMALRTADMKLLARLTPGIAEEVAVGSTTMSAELRDAITSNPQRGVLVSRVALDGVERTTAYRRVEGWPLMVLAGVANDRFFAPWRTEMRQISALAAAAWLLILATTVLAYVAWSAEWRSIRALGRQTRLMEAMMRTTADGIHIINDDGRVIAMSDSFAQMLGTSPDKLRGQHISSWDVHNDEHRVAEWLAKAHVGDRQRTEVQHRRGDGRILDVDLQISVTSIEGERLIFASARDITERKRLQASLEESSARIRDLYDHAPCGYHSLDADGVFVHVNATMLQWLGCGADEVIGHARMADFLDDEGRATFATHFPRLKVEGHIDGVDFKLVPRDGPVRYLRASVTAILDASGHFAMSRSVTLDVTASHDAWVETARVLREQTAMLDNDIVAMVKLRDGVMVWKNRALARMFGYAPGELDGQSARLLPRRPVVRDRRRADLPSASGRGAISQPAAAAPQGRPPAVDRHERRHPRRRLVAMDDGRHHGDEGPAGPDGAHRVPRCADRVAEPAAAGRPDASIDPVMSAIGHLCRGLLPRPGRVQAGQRPPRPRGGRCAAGGDWAAPAVVLARQRHGRANRRRRIRGAVDHAG